LSDITSRRLIIPQLGRVYDALAPWTTLLVRVVAGLSFIPHGYPKLFVDPAGTAQFFEKSGFHPGMLWAILVGCTETFGGLFLALGLLTRLACIPVLIFLLTAISFHAPNGFAWNRLGFEYPLFWSIVVFHFLVHGGGRYSLDAVLGREV
jgi:putative oxidoreductase